MPNITPMRRLSHPREAIPTTLVTMRPTSEAAIRTTRKITETDYVEHSGLKRQVGLEEFAQLCVEVESCPDAQNDCNKSYDLTYKALAQTVIYSRNEKKQKNDVQNSHMVIDKKAGI